MNRNWIIHGNVVIPTGNPFDESEVGNDHQREALDTSDDRIVLGPGLIILVNHVVEIDDGIIVRICPSNGFTETTKDTSRQAQNLIKLGREEFLVPGLIDLHIHAPQYSYAGTATDRPLMGPQGWLETYTFPAEQSLTDLTKAREVYNRVVRATLRHGTTTALYFATLHLQPTKVLVDVALDIGQRALIGKVAMDRNAPETYVQSLEQNVKETEQLIEYIHQRAGPQHADPSPALLPLVLPVVTPRFIPTCTPQLLAALGRIAQQRNCHITTHLSESTDEVQFSCYLDANIDGGGGRTDTQILDQHGLLTSQSVLAHGVYVTRNDQELLRRRGAALAHCPLSNFFFAGGCLPTRQLLQANNRVGLGTDVAGGYSPSMWNASRMAVVASQALQQHRSPCNSDSQAEARPASAISHVLDYRHAFYLATLGGARALGLDHRFGTLRVGLEFDAVILSASTNSNGASASSPVEVFPSDSVADIFQKLCVLGDDRNIRRVFVQGRDVTL